MSQSDQGCFLVDFHDCCLKSVLFIIPSWLFCLGSRSDSESLASEEGANDDNTDDELSKVVGGLEFAIDRQETDIKKEQTQEMTAESQQEEDIKPVEKENENKPLHSLQSVRTAWAVI